jgi:hypothetical protein
MVTWSDVVALAPELASVPETAQGAILGQVAEQLATAAWGTRLATGQTYLAAHLGTLRGTKGYRTEQVADHRRDTTGDLDSTSYGREFRRLCRSLPLVLVSVAD